MRCAGNGPVLCLFVANIAIFLLMVCSNGIRCVIIPSSQTLLNWGASTAYLTLGQCQWWRLLTSSFVHAGIFHLGINLFVLRDIGKEIEAWFGPRRFCAIWFTAAAGGAITSLFAHPISVSEGASAAIFGLFGAMLVFVWRRKNLAPAGSLKLHAKIILILVGYTAICGFFDKTIDNASHFGGLLSGFLAALLFLPSKSGDTLWRLADSGKLACILLLCAGAYFGAYSLLARAPDVVAEGEYATAVKLLQAEKFDLALAHLNKTLELTPGNESALCDRARALAKLKKFEEAMTDCNSALNSAANKKLVHFTRADVLHQMRRYTDAGQDLDKVIELDGKDAVAFNNRAWNYAAAGSYAKALKDCDIALSLDPHLTTAYDTRATVEILLSRYSDALADLDKAISLKPTDGAYYFHRALVKEKMRQPGLQDDLAKASKYKYDPEDWEPKPTTMSQ